jgi:hypothetical protein
LKTIRNIITFKAGLSWLPFSVFFIGVFIYFAFLGEYILYYQEKSSIFFLTSSFLAENAHQPGGLLLWLGKLATSFFIFPYAGAIIISSVLTLTAFISSKIIFALSGKSGVVFSLLIASAFLYLQTEYRFLFFNTIGILLQLILLLLSVRYLKTLKGWSPLLILPVLYFATGGFAWIYSMMLSFLYILKGIKTNSLKLIAVWAVNILTFYFLKEIIFFQTTSTLLTYPWSGPATGTQSELFIGAAIIISLLPLLSAISLLVPEKLKFSKPVSILLTSTLIAILVTAISVLKYDRKIAAYFHVEKLFCEGKFREVIDWNLAHPPTNKLTIFLNNIALCETARLNDMLLSFPQSPDGSTLFLKWEMTGEILRRGGYFYYATGMINEAHRWAFENMVMKGHTPDGLKMLIRTEIINGNYKIASRYIDLLKHTLFHRKEALAFEKFLFNDQAVNADPGLGAKRQIKLKTDFFTITDDPYINIERIFSLDSLNRKAFEYKVAFSLLRKDYRSIAEELPKFGLYGYSKFPLNVEEAAVALSVFNKGNLPDLGNLAISSNTAKRWEQYLTVFQNYGTNLQKAEPALRKQFGNTFWYYAFYR